MVWATSLKSNYDMTPPRRKLHLQPTNWLLFKPLRRTGNSTEREFIVNSLFFSLALFACLKMVSSAIQHQPLVFDQKEDTMVANGIFLLVVIGLWHIFRHCVNAHCMQVRELQRFAEFGRLSANLVHEIANPLTAASLNLEQCDNKKSLLLIQARKNLQQLERYLEAARKQIKTQTTMGSFPIRHELNQIADIMSPLACRAGVKLKIEQSGNYNLYGDSVKFHQLVSNLVTNAIDAYAHTGRSTSIKHVAVTVKKSGQWLKLQVTDWGKGIDTPEFAQVFEPFYTTKYKTGHGMGIGLALVKQYVTVDFGGSIQVRSSRSHGTQFTAKLRFFPSENDVSQRQYSFKQFIIEDLFVRMLTVLAKLRSILIRQYYLRYKSWKIGGIDMNHYVFDTGSRQIQGSHTLLIGPPLFIISLFCFGLVLLQPAPPPLVRKTASRHSTTRSQAQSKAQIPLVNNADLPKLTKEPVTAVPAAVPKPTTPITPSPQVSNAPITSLQSATPNNQTKPSGIDLKTPASHVTPILDHLKIIR